MWLIITILLVLWLLGFTTHVGGGLVHIILVALVIIVVVRLLRGGPNL